MLKNEFNPYDLTIAYGEQRRAGGQSQSESEAYRVEGQEGEAVVAEGDGDLSDAAKEQHLAVALHGLPSLSPLLSSTVSFALFFPLPLLVLPAGTGTGTGARLSFGWTCARAIDWVF